MPEHFYRDEGSNIGEIAGYVGICFALGIVALLFTAAKLWFTRKPITKESLALPLGCFKIGGVFLVILAFWALVGLVAQLLGLDS